MRKKLYLLSAAGLCIAVAFGASVAREDQAGSKPGLTPLDGRSGSGIGPGGYSGLLLRQRAQGASTRSLERAVTFLQMAARTDQPNAALTLLRRALELDLPDTPEGQRVLSNVHYRLAGLYEYEPKQAFHLAMSGRHAGSDAQRSRIEEQIAALGAGTMLLDLAQAADPSSPRPVDRGAACDAAGSAGSFTGAGEHFTATSLNIPRGGAGKWYAITVAAAESGVGLSFHAETFSDVPGSLDDDAVLELWSGCAAGVPSGLIGFGDDRGGNAPLMASLETGCLAPGTYFLNVRAFDAAAKADGIDLQIQALGACAVAAPDAFEPDNSRADATRLDFSSPVGPAGLPGPAAPAALAALAARPFPRGSASAVQAHSVFPAGDEDWVRFELKRDSLMRIRTGCGFPTLSGDGGDGAECENPPELDTNLELYYASETTTYGLCNQTANPTDPPGLIDGSSSNACVTDLDCDTDGDGVVFPDDPDDLQNPFPGLPACLPWTVFSNTPVDPVDNPLAFSDDASFPANLGADLTVCLPRTRKSHNPSLSVNADPAPRFSWYVRTGGWSPDGEIANSTLTFDYELAVERLGDCNFETEPNGNLPARNGDGDDDDDDDDSRGGPDRLTIGESVHGIWDFSATQPAPDFDLYLFDVTEPSAILFEIDGFDPIAVDTFIELVVGPDDDGRFFLTGHSNDDVSASDLRSRMEVYLPPACEMLGNCLPGAEGAEGAEGPESEAESAYYLNVTSAFVVPNFPYELKTSVLESVSGEVEDFGDCGSGEEAPLAIGQRYLAHLEDVCDFDGYKFSLAESRSVRLATGPSGTDTVMELRDCNTGEVLACDDDGGPGFQSAMQGCLPGGRDYCVRVRAWDGTRTFHYSIEASGGEICEAEDPPAIMAGGSAVCSAFDVCP